MRCYRKVFHVYSKSGTVQFHYIFAFSPTLLQILTLWLLHNVLILFLLKTVSSFNSQNGYESDTFFKAFFSMGFPLTLKSSPLDEMTRKKPARSEYLTGINCSRGFAEGTVRSFVLYREQQLRCPVPTRPNHNGFQGRFPGEVLFISLKLILFSS